MTQRERFLAIAVGGLMLAIGLQWAFTKHRTAVKQRTNLITNLEQQKQRLQEELLQGAYADRQMGEYVIRSLPSDAERAKSDYQKWLLDLVQTHGIANAVVDPTTSIPMGDLYERYGFSLTGKASLPQVTSLLHDFYAKDYLHRVMKISVTPSRTGDLTLKMDVDGISLKSAPKTNEPSKQTSWKVNPEIAEYRDAVLNRNFFSPPNEPPKFGGSNQVDVVVGKETRTEIKFSDPEGHQVNYTLVGNSPDFIELDSRTGSLKVNPTETGKHELLVRATDNGFPSRSVEQPLILVISDPPPPLEPEKPKPEFDDSKQTVLTGLVQGRDDWMAWMNIRTRGETLKLRVGDGFEIGSLKGTVIEVTQRFAVLEIDGRRFTLLPSGNLADAAKSALED